MINRDIPDVGNRIPFHLTNKAILCRVSQGVNRRPREDLATPSRNPILWQGTTPIDKPDIRPSGHREGS